VRRPLSRQIFEDEKMSEAERDVRFVADQIYSHAGGSARLADVYIPEATFGPRPVVIWLHGGGWRFGDRRLAPDLRTFAQRSGLAVVSIDYRLSDDARFPAQVEDVKTAVRWVRSMAGKFGLDGDHIGLWGSSAGGHLAACAALSKESEFLSEEHSEHSSAVQAVVDGYGPTNFGRIDADRATMLATGTDAESVVIGHVLPAADPDSFESRLLGTQVSTSPREVELADPVYYVRGKCPPFLILHGKADTLIPCQQSQYLFHALSNAGNDVTLVLFENLKHGFFNNPGLARESYGTVTVHRSSLIAIEKSWECNPHEDIPSMVSSFFRAHLAG
jgi:acetyl esterase/lipase